MEDDGGNVMKARVTQKEAMKSFEVLIYTNMDLSRLNNNRQPEYYTAGAYGWNADIYDVSDYMPKNNRMKVALVTGDRSFGTHHAPYDMLYKYVSKADAMSSFEPKTKSKRNALLRGFLKEFSDKVLARDIGR